MTSLTPTRKIQISFEDGHDTRSTLASFFHTLSIYGTIEQMQLRRDLHYGLCEVEVQFQKLSCAEQLYQDSIKTTAATGGKKWTMKFLPSTQCAGDTLLLSSADPFPANFLDVMAERLGITTTRLTSEAGVVCWEEKLLEVPDGAPHTVGGVGFHHSHSSYHRGTDFHRGGRQGTSSSSSLSPSPAPPVFRNVWQLMQQAVNLVQLHSAGPYVGLMHFSDPHKAHQFLVEHQRQLSTPSAHPPPPSPSSSESSFRIVAMYSGAGATEETSAALHLAASRLLPRHRAEDLQVGAVLRGVVLRKQQEYTICVVEAGVRYGPSHGSGGSAMPSSQAVWISTNAKVLRVGVGDEVDVQLTALQRGRGMNITRIGSTGVTGTGGASHHHHSPIGNSSSGVGGGSNAAMWSGTLLKVVTEAAEICRNAPVALAPRRHAAALEPNAAARSSPIAATTTATATTNNNNNIIRNNNTSRLLGGSPGGDKTSNPLTAVLSQLTSSLPTTQRVDQGGVSPSTAQTGSTSASATRSLASQLLRRAQQSATSMTSSSDQASPSAPTPPPPPHLREACPGEETVGQDDNTGAGVERLHEYPSPLYLHAKLLVEVTHVTPEGIVARLMAVDDEMVTSSPSSWLSAVSVFVPAVFVPGWTSGTEDRQRMAVEGERLTAALLYVVAVGGSAATRRCIASLREADVNRSRGRSAAMLHQTASTKTSTTTSENGMSNGFQTGVDKTASVSLQAASGLKEGTILKGTIVLPLSAESIGVRGLGGPPGAVFPAFLMRPTLQAPAAAHQIPLLLAQQDVLSGTAASGDGVVVSTPRLAELPHSSSLITVVVFAIYRSASRGCFAVVTTPEAYAQQVQWREQERQRKLAAERAAPSSSTLDPKLLAIKNVLANALKATREEEEQQQQRQQNQRKRSKLE